MAGLLRNYKLMLTWQALSSKTVLPLLLAVQLAVSLGFVIGIGFLYPSITPEIAKFLTTGAPTMNLLMVGLVLLPQMVATSKTEGTFDYMWSLPVPRMVYVAADATIYILLCTPGIILSLITGAIYYHFGLHFSLLVIPAMLLIAMAGIFLGYSIAHSIAKPQVTQLITQLLVFFIFIFSPIMFPASQLPSWLATVHKFLPIQYMADLSRGTLTDLHVNLGLAFAVVGAWCLLGLIVTSVLVRRQR
jgi:ABC-2 type transport system permease protein